MVAGLVLTTALLAQGGGPGRAADGKPSREEVVQAALNKQTIVAVERQGALILRDLKKRCGAEDAAVLRLGEALNQAIKQWVEAHPPQVYGNYQPDWRATQKLVVWEDAVANAMPPAVRTAWQGLETERQQRLITATSRFVRAVAACEMRLAPDQVTAIDPLCLRIAEQSAEFAVRARPGQLVRELDRNGAHVLSEIQTDYQDQLTARAAKRDANAEFLLECERIRLLCKLDDDRAHLLRACGKSQGKKQLAMLQQKAKAEAAAQAAAAKAAADQAGAAPAPAAAVAAVAKPVAPAGNGLPDDSCLADPFWTKVRDTLLTAAEKELLAATPAPAQAAVVAARVEFLIASLDSLFHLDPEQLKAIAPLAQRVVEQDLTSIRIASMDVTRGFGLQASRQETTPEERGAMKALEELLDRPQFEVLRDKVGI